jgi:hypothetical protein
MGVVESTTWTPGQGPVSGFSQAAGGTMDLQRLCAYNQTRECFLGLEVASADLSLAELKVLLGKLALKSGEGLWMAPFRGIPDTNMRVPLDLLYLDQDCRVIETVESFPTFHATTSSSLAASVLALPAHSIYSSQTQPGDQLVLCVAEEMQHRLERFFSANSAAGGVQSGVLLREKTPWSGASDVAESEDLSTRERPKSSPLKEIGLSQSKTENVSQPKSWLERWWSSGSRKAPELRKAPREPLPGLAAYYWTGAAPKAHSVRDISSTGLYVVTEERWYPGTLILMTLQETDEEESAERSISVHSRAVRWGNDGVGLQFIPQDAPEARKGLNTLAHGVDRKELEQFLERLLRKDND